MPKQSFVAERRAEDVSRWRFSRTVSLDSIVVLTVTMLSGVIFILTMSAKIEQQARDLANLQKLVERVESDQKERAARLEKDAAERSDRIEKAVKEQGQLVQSIMVPRLQR